MPAEISASNISSEKPKRFAIIGGGITGLAAAYFLLKNSREQSTAVDIDLYEANPRLGGVFGTVHEAGYRIETGADMFITNKPAALQLALELGLEQRMIPTEARYRRSLILKNGRPIPTPAGFDLMLPRNVMPFLKSPLLSWRGKLRVLYEYFLPGQPQADETLASFARRRFGKEAFDRIIQPMIGGIYTADPEKLSLRATLPRFLEMEAEHGSLIRAALLEKKLIQSHSSEQASGARYGLFVSFDEGMSVFQQAIIDAVQPECQLLLNHAVQSLQKRSDGKFALTCSDSAGQQQSKEYDTVFLTLPAPRAAEILQAHHVGLSQALQQIEYASAAIVVTGHRLENSRHPLDAFGLVIPAIENRRILAVSLTSRKFPDRAPEGSIQVRTFIGGALQQELLKKPDEELTTIVREELQDIFGLTGKPEIIKVVRWNQAMPQYHLGHAEKVTKIQQLADDVSGLYLAGNAYHGVGLPDVIQSAAAAVSRYCQSSST